MRILFTRFPLESAYGGAEVQTLSLMRGLTERGHAVSFLGSCPVLLKEAASCKLQATRLDIGVPPVTKWHALSFLWRQWAMRRLLLDTLNRLPAPRAKLTALIMLSLSEKLLLTEWAIAQGMKVLWIEHDRVGRWLTANPWKVKLRRLSRLVETVVVSSLSRTLYINLGWDSSRIVAIPNGVDLKRIDSAPSLLPPLYPHPLHIGCIARLTRDKGVDLLLEAITDLPDVSLTIVGTGRDERHILSLIHRIRTHTPVQVYSSVPDLGAFYRSLDVFVLPSREHDPFGLAAAEAMTLGIPVVVTDVCGIAGYLTDGNDALIANANSALAIREAIVTLRNPAVRATIAEAGRRTAKEKFSLERMVGAYEQLIGA